MTFTTLHPDILVQGPDGRPVAVVELKNRRNLSPDVAADLHRQLLGYGTRSQAPYLLLLSQDSGFLWKNPDAEGTNNFPSYGFPMTNVVARYLPHLNSGERLRESELELLVLQWLNSLTDGLQYASDEPEKSLATSGFLEAIQGAMVISEPQW